MYQELQGNVYSLVPPYILDLKEVKHEMLLFALFFFKNLLFLDTNIKKEHAFLITWALYYINMYIYLYLASLASQSLFAWRLSCIKANKKLIHKYKAN